MAQVIAFLKIIQDGIFPQNKTESISTTNFLFRLHVKYIATTVVITGVLIFIQQLFVDHLKCFRPGNEGTALDVGVLNQFCYATTGTYSNHTDTSHSIYQFQHYFQWVPYILLVQGILLHVPQLVWKKFVEDGRLERYCVVNVKTATVGETRSHSEPQLTGVGAASASGGGDTASASVAELPSPTSASKRRSKVLSISFAKTLRSSSNKYYFWGFLCCEFLNLIIVLICFFSTDWLLHGRFAGMGANWVVYLQDMRDLTKISDMKEMQLERNIDSLKNPLEVAFPTMFTCRWNKGNSILQDGDGITQIPELKYKVTCVMSLNIIHQRIYLVFWFGFILLFCGSIVNCIYTVILCVSGRLRRYLVAKLAKRKGIPSTPELQEIVAGMSCYDWFILKRILNNVDSQRFDTICEEVREILQNPSTTSVRKIGSLKEMIRGKNGSNMEMTVVKVKDQGNILEMQPMHVPIL